MNDKQLEIFKKGNYRKIDNKFLCKTLEVSKKVSEIQKEFDKMDMDTLLNEFHDSLTGRYLNYELVNIDKHGFDCKRSINDDIFLEVKSASFYSSSIAATFNDTTFEKAEAFMDKKVFLALGVWSDISNLLFICYGQNIEIGKYLKTKVDYFKQGNTVRSTQSISLSRLVFDYNFKIYTQYDKKYIYDLLISKSNTFKKLNYDDIIYLKDLK